VKATWQPCLMCNEVEIVTQTFPNCHISSQIIDFVEFRFGNRKVLAKRLLGGIALPLLRALAQAAGPWLLALRVFSTLTVVQT